MKFPPYPQKVRSREGNARGRGISRLYNSFEHLTPPPLKKTCCQFVYHWKLASLSCYVWRWDRNPYFVRSNIALTVKAICIRTISNNNRFIGTARFYFNSIGKQTHIIFRNTKWDVFLVCCRLHSTKSSHYDSLKFVPPFTNALIPKSCKCDPYICMNDDFYNIFIIKITGIGESKCFSK